MKPFPAYKAKIILYSMMDKKEDTNKSMSRRLILGLMLWNVGLAYMAHLP